MPQSLAGPVDALVVGQVGVDIVHRRFDPVQQVADGVQAFGGHQDLPLGERMVLRQGPCLVCALAMRWSAVAPPSPRPGVGSEPAPTPGAPLLSPAFRQIRHCDEILEETTDVSLILADGLLYFLRQRAHPERPRDRPCDAAATGQFRWNTVPMPDR